MPNNRRVHLQHLRSSTLNKVPTSNDLNDGEIAVNYNSASPRLFIRDSGNNIIQFIPSAATESLITAATSDCLTGVTLNGSAATVTDKVADITSSTIYAGTAEPSPSLGGEGDIYLQTNPVVIYETDGTTGLLGHNQSSFENQWQLENLDLTPYKYIKCYFKATTLTDASKYTPAVIVTVQLDDAARGATTYFGGTMTPLPFNRNRYYLVSCAVDGTKTKFQVVHQNTIWDVTTSDANGDGRYLYKIEGYV